MIYTTLNEIRSADPRKDVWEKLLTHLGKTQPDDEPLPLVTVLDSAGLDATIRCLRVCPDVAAEFARWCADRAAKAAEDAYWAARAARAAEDAYWAARAARAARAAGISRYAGISDWPSFWAAEAAEAAGIASYWAAGITAAEAERKAQTDKLRELLS